MNEELEPYRQRCRDLESENDKLKADVDALTILQDQSDSAAKSLIDKLNAQIHEQTITIKLLEERIKELEEEINSGNDEANREK